MEEALLNKDHEISILQNKIREIEEVVEVDDLESEKADSDSDTTDSEINDLINEATELDSDSDDLSVENHDCDFCDFTSVHMNGLKVHKARKHRIKCDECKISFQDEDCLKRHLETKQILENIDGKDKADMKVKSFKLDEKCLGIFATEKDEINPFMILHSDDCWYRSGHPCSDLPVDTEVQVDTTTITHNLTMAGC